MDKLRGLGPRSYWWWSAGVAIVIVAVLVTPLARTRPGYDPYGWLAWGWRTLHGGLDTNAAPSFKPLPYLFTVPYALAGRGAELRLWMDTVTALSLAGVAVAGRLAYRLTVGSDASRRWAGALAAAVAMAAVLGLHDETGETYLHYVLSAQSDPIVVALVLGAIDCGLSRRWRACWGLTVLAALGRPEVWPLAAVLGLWWWRLPARSAVARGLIVAGVAVVVALWFGIPALTSRSALVAADNAYHFPGAPTGDKLTGVLGRFWLQSPWPLLAAAALAVAAATARRDRTVLVLAGGAVLWIAVEVAMTLHGWPGLGRYLFEPSAVADVLGAALAGRLLAGDLSGRRIPARALGAVLAAALVAAMIAPSVDQAHAERQDLIGPGGQHARTARLADLAKVVGSLGGPARVRGCGELVINVEYQSAAAFLAGENVSAVGVKLAKALRHRRPLIVLTPQRVGPSWTVHGVRQTAPACRQALSGRSG